MSVRVLPVVFSLFSLPSLTQRPRPLRLTANTTPNSQEQGALLGCIALFQYGLGLSAAAGRAAGLGSVGGQNGNRRQNFLERKEKSGDSRLFCGEQAVMVGSG